MLVMTGMCHLQSNGSLVGPLSPIQADRNYRIIFLGSWRQLKPDVGVRTVTASKYLGVINGDDRTLSAKAITERIAKVHSQIDMWDSRLSSSPVDRAMVAKTMCLSII